MSILIWPDPILTELADQLFPGKRVRDFSIHFRVDGLPTITAEFIVEREDGEQILEWAKRHTIQIGKEIQEKAPDMPQVP